MYRSVDRKLHEIYFNLKVPRQVRNITQKVYTNVGLRVNSAYTNM